MKLFGSKKSSRHSGERASADGSRQSRTAKTETTEEQSGKSVDEIVAARNKKGKKKKTGKVILIILLVLVLLAGIGYAVLEFVIKPPDTDNKGVTDNTNTPHVDGRKDGVYTFLVAGTDQISNNTDTIMIGSFDTVNHKLNIVSIPRDTLINIQHEVKKANSAYHYAAYYKNVEGSSYYNCDPVESMRKELVKSMLGFDVDKYVLVNLNAAAEVVDAIGGVEFDLPIDMNYDDPAQDLHIHFKAGQQHLTGQQAMEVVRFRHNNNGGGYPLQDLDRIKTQQAFLSAVADKMFSLQSVVKIPEFARIFSENVKSDLAVGEMIWFGNQALDIGTENIRFTTLPGEAKTVYGGSYYVLDREACLALFNESFNPYKAALSLSDLDIKAA